jgi:hypothetical protein
MRYSRRYLPKPFPLPITALRELYPNEEKLPNMYRLHSLRLQGDIVYIQSNPNDKFFIDMVLKKHLPALVNEYNAVLGAVSKPIYTIEAPTISIRFENYMVDRQT